LLVTPAVVGYGSFTVLLMNNGEIVYITKGIANASITTIITTSILLFNMDMTIGAYKRN
jgi:hypothetical protein